MNKREMVEKLLWSNSGMKVSKSMLDELDRIYGVREDDGEQVTAEWLDAISTYRKNLQTGTNDWEFGSSDPEVMVRRYHYQPESYFLLLAQKDEMDCVTFELTTRLQFRRLCEALGIELKEAD